MRTSCPGVIVIACLVAVSVLLSASTVDAEAPYPFMGLIDSDHFLWFLYDVPLYQQFEVYAWVQPGDDGLICGEFDIAYDDILIFTGSMDNPEALIVVEPDPSGITVCFADCRTDWVWLRKFTFMTTSIDRAYVNLVPHPVSETLQVFNCMEGNPAVPANLISPVFCVNDPECHVAVSERSWGAIKAIYDD